MFGTLKDKNWRFFDNSAVSFIIVYKSKIKSTTQRIKIKINK